MRKLKQFKEGQYYRLESPKFTHFHKIYLRAQRCKRCTVPLDRDRECGSKGIGLYTLEGERWACGSSEVVQGCIRISKVRLLLEKLL